MYECLKFNQMVSPSSRVITLAFCSVTVLYSLHFTTHSELVVECCKVLGFLDIRCLCTIRHLWGPQEKQSYTSKNVFGCVFDHRWQKLSC